MQLLRQEDPRDSLAKASRYELCQLAEEHGIPDVHYSANLTLEQMIDRIRSAGIQNIKIPDRPLGVPMPVVLGADGPPLSEEKPRKPVAEMSIIELRSACKAKGIKMARTDNSETLRAKLV